MRRGTVFNCNLDVVQAKGSIPYWKIANELNVSEQTVRNWMRHEMNPQKKDLVLSAIARLKQDLAVAN